MKKGFNSFITIIIICAILAVVVYYTVEVCVARATTQGIVDDIMNTGQIKMTVNDLTERQLEIFLKVEDPNFYGHHGVDFGTPGAGWTTITQGLAKKFYFAHFEQGIMKIKQSLCAWLALDPLVDKDTQLTIYMNISYFGNGVTGLVGAAEYYYGKNVSELTEDEYISLIASLVDPNGLNVKDHPEENAQRVTRIKKLLAGEYKPKGLFDILYEGAD